jgi:oligoribonuclease NrnB/cAMP/cGMP phosphodiesterase (DHH superfamily)
MNAISRVPGEGDTLSISDLGYFQGAEGVVASLTSHGWRVEWRDHHRWRDEEHDRVALRCELLHVHVDTCATGICARDLAPDDPIATEVARVVCDYDLWTHADPRSAILGQVLQRKKNRDYVRDCLVQGIFSDDRIMEQYREIRNDMERLMEKSIRKAQIRGTRFRIAFAPLYGYPSETAAEMRSSLSTDMEVLISPSGRFSLRSVPPVSHILARNFGGGGHPNAAGGNFPFTFWESIFFRLFGRSAHIDRFVDIAESLE